MEVRSFPGSLAHPELEALETALQSLAFPPPPAGCGLLGGEFFQIFANHARQGRILLDGYFSHRLNEFIVEGESYVHVPIIRETRNPCNGSAAHCLRRAFGVMGVTPYPFGTGVVVQRGLGWQEVKRASPMPAGSIPVASTISAGRAR